MSSPDTFFQRDDVRKVLRIVYAVLLSVGLMVVIIMTIIGGYILFDSGTPAAVWKTLTDAEKVAVVFLGVGALGIPTLWFDLHKLYHREYYENHPARNLELLPYLLVCLWQVMKRRVLWIVRSVNRSVPRLFAAIRYHFKGR